MGETALYIGIALALLGLAGLGLCIWKAVQLKRAENHGQTDETRAAMHKLVALNMASVGTGFFGLALVVVGLLFR